MFDGKFVLLVDMDDVMENLMDVWFEMLDEIQANNPTYRSIKMKDHTSWDVVPLYPMLTVDEIFQPLNMPEIWQRITPIPGAVRVLKKINKDPRVVLRVCTASHYTAVAPKREFLRKNFPFISWNQVIITPDKQLVNADALIDDRFDNHIGGTYQGILFDKPWNKYADEKPYGIIRAKNWLQIEKILKELITKKCGTVEEWVARNKNEFMLNQPV